MAAALRAGGRPRLKSYTAKGWHAQITKLVSSPRGYAAANKVGLTATKRTVLAWLSEEQTPSAANQQKIQDAYEEMAGKFPNQIIGADVRISGLVAIGNDVRDRGDLANNPLLIEGYDTRLWDDIKDAWNRGTLIPEDFEALFVGLIVDDALDGPSEPLEFPGGDYIVTFD